MPRSWFVLYSKPRAEKKTAERLERDGFQVFCPTRKVLKQWSDRKKWIQEPVLPSYLFVHCEEHEREKILQDPGAVRFVFWQKRPLAVRDIDLEKFRSFLEAGRVDQVEWVDLAIGQNVKISSGPFSGEDVEVMEDRGKAVVVRFLEGNQGLLLKIGKGEVS